MALQKFQTPKNSEVDKDWFKKNVTLNSFGYRDFKYSQERPNNIFRILVLGDSITFGQGIKKTRTN